MEHGKYLTYLYQNKLDELDSIKKGGGMTISFDSPSEIEKPQGSAASWGISKGSIVISFNTKLLLVLK